MEKCQQCGRLYSIDKLDAKPARFAGKPFTLEDLEFAIQSGEDFTRLECAPCYGPAYTPGVL